MNPPLAPPRRGTDRTRTDTCSPPGRGWGWVVSWKARITERVQSRLELSQFRLPVREAFSVLLQNGWRRLLREVGIVELRQHFLNLGLDLRDFLSEARLLCLDIHQAFEWEEQFAQFGQRGWRPFCRREVRIHNQ